MFNFLHTYLPEPILISFGNINIYWYGVFIVTGILAAILISFKLADKYQVSKDIVIDSAFWLIIGGIVGARLYHVYLEIPYYLENPSSIIKVWQGGLAIHGGVFAGILIVWILAKRNKLNFWLLSSIYVPGLILAQAIGRWGNYFNQELFGLPTTLPWGIPIETANRIPEFYNSQYFHPTFLYESLGNLAIFIILFLFHQWIVKNKKPVFFNMLVVFGYLVLYSILRFSMEFIRIDATPEVLGLRFPQIVSIILVIFSIVFVAFKNWKPGDLKKNG